MFYLNIKTVIIGIITVFLSLLFQKPSLAADWLHFGYDDQYTSYNPLEKKINVKNVNKLKRKWGIGCDDAWFSVIFRTPAIWQEKLYTSGAGSRLTAYVFNAFTGKFLWQFGQGNLGWAPQPVVSEDGVIFYMEETYPTYLYAVNRNGQQLWKAPIGFDLGFTGAVEAVVTIDESRQIVYLVDEPFFKEQGKLYALSKLNGSILWYKSKAKDGVAFRGDYVLLKGNSIFALGYVNDQQLMLRIDASTKVIDRRYQIPGVEGYYDISAYTLCNNNLIVEFADRDDVFKSKSLVVAYNVDSPNIVWQKEYSGPVTGKIACNTKKNTVYVPTDPYLDALKADSGVPVWRYTGYGPIYNPSIANGIVYFISDTNMYAIDEQTRTRLFAYPLGREGEVTTQVAIDDGVLFFSGNGGTCDLYALYVPDILFGAFKQLSSLSLRF